MIEQNKVKVETRLLQLILSHTTFDRVTIGILHWDLSSLRVASYLDYLNLYDLSNREDVRKTAYSIINRAKIVKVNDNDPLEKFFNVRTGIRENISPTIYYSPAHIQEYRPWLRPEPQTNTLPDTLKLFNDFCKSVWGNKQYKIER